MRTDIYLIGDIDEQAYERLHQEFCKRGAKGVLRIILLSNGGDADVALAMYDLIRSYPGEVVITATGIVASAAVLVLAAGDVRRMTPSSWVMVHEEQFNQESLKLSDVSRLEKDARHYRRKERQWAELLEAETDTDAEKWADLHGEEAHLTAEECLKLGLIDEVLK